MDDEASFALKEVHMYMNIPSRSPKTPSPVVYPGPHERGLPLNMIILLFAQLGASFCLLDGRNHSLLPLAQLLANHYLLDLKILAVVKSCLAIQDLSFWRLYTGEKAIYATESSQIQKEEVAIDGVVEEGLITFKN